MAHTLLINPPFYRFIGLEQDYVPLSLLAVGSKMKHDGIDVVVKNMEIASTSEYEGYLARAENYDLYLKCLNDDSHPVWQELISLINDLSPKRIGLTVMNVKYKSAQKIINIAKSMGVDILVGGSHPTIEPSLYDVDVCVGEYEKLWRVGNLDETPFPNYDILMDEYSPNGYGHIMSSRGCPYSCKFCSSKAIWGNRVTYKSIDRTISEMRYVHNRFGTDYFTFWDETFTCNKKRIKEFCQKYDVDANWRCDTRADSINDEIVKMMKDSGCGQMSLGIECADNDTLLKIGKNETTDTFMRAAEILNKNNIQWKAYCIIGFPSDTEETILRSIEFIKSLEPFRITLSFFTPYRGTELYDEVRNMGLINDNYDMSLFSHQSPHNYFCPQISKERYMELKKIVSLDIDNYNKNALKIWK